MLKNYFVKYWTKEGSIVGVNVSALSEFSALDYVKQYPNFGSMLDFPVEVRTLN